MPRKKRYTPRFYMDYFGAVAKLLREHDTVTPGQPVLTAAEIEQMDDAAERGYPAEMYAAWLLVSRGVLVNRIRKMEREQEQTRAAVNRILARFAVEGRPIIEEADTEMEIAA